jgi:hypothetical protein
LDLERLTVAVRPRSYAEAIDLGFGMGRRWWTATIVPWLLVVLPIPILGFVFLYEHPGWVIFAVWWLKPLYDRIPLHVISRAFFGDLPRSGDTVRALPGLLRRRALVGLTIYRLDPMRAVHLPVAQLEGLKGPALARRRRVVSRGAGGHAMLLMMACMLFELVLTWMPLMLILAFLPQGYASAEWTDRLFVEQDPVWILRAGWVTMGAWIGAVTFIEPLFVAAGFSLYINRRTLIEAWDIEVDFRRMTSRLASGRGKVALVLLPLLLVAGAAEPSLAQAPPTEETLDAADPAAVIEEVLSDEVFGHEEVRSFRELRWSADSNGGAGIFGLGAVLGAVLARVLVVVLAILLIYLLVRIVLNLAKEREPEAPEAEAPPEVVVGLEVTRESLPEDVPREARALWDAGDRTGAVRLLYRAALTHLIHEGLPVRDSATEGDCLRLTRKAHTGELGRYFERLTGVWVHSAYGHVGPGDELGDELIGGWQTSFGATT